MNESRTPSSDHMLLRYVSRKKPRPSLYTVGSSTIGPSRRVSRTCIARGAYGRREQPAERVDECARRVRLLHPRESTSAHFAALVRACGKRASETVDQIAAIVLGPNPPVHAVVHDLRGSGGRAGDHLRAARHGLEACPWQILGIIVHDHHVCEAIPVVVVPIR